MFTLIATHIYILHKEMKDGQVHMCVCLCVAKVKILQYATTITMKFRYTVLYDITCISSNQLAVQYILRQ